MSELRRLLRYVRPWSTPLFASVILMAGVGAMQGLVVLLVGPIFDRVLDPTSADKPVLLFTIPLLHRQIYLQSLVPRDVHNVWTMVAGALVTAMLLRGFCDYFGNYLINYVGFSAVTDLRQAVFDRVLHQDAQFFRGQLHRPRDVVDHERSRKNPGGAVAHSGGLAAAELHGARRCWPWCCRRDWRLALVSLTVLPFVLVPTMRLGRRIRRTTRRAQDDAAELNQVLQETLSGHQVVKSFGAEEIESNRFRDRAEAAAREQSALCRAAGHRFAADRIFRRADHRRPAHLRARPDQGPAHDHGRVHQLRDRAADAV